MREYISMNFEGLRDLVVQMFSCARCIVDIGTFQNDMTSFKSRDDVLTALIREMPSGKGYADMVFLPRKYSTRPALIIELKYGQSAESAIAQIKERQYAETLRNYHGNLLLVGISYDRESKKHCCIIEEQEKG